MHKYNTLYTQRINRHVLTPESLPNNCPAHSKKFFLDKNSSIGIIKKQYEIGFQIRIKYTGLRLMWICGVQVMRGFHNYLLINNRKDIFIIWTDCVREKGLYL